MGRTVGSCLAAMFLTAQLLAQEHAGPSRDPVAQLDWFGTEVAAHLQAADFDWLRGVVDLDVLVDRATAGIDTSSTVGKEIALGTRDGLAEAQWLRQLTEGQSGVVYRYLRAIERTGGTHLLFRIASPEGLFFVELVVRRVGDEVRIIDAYSYLTGELVSYSTRAMVALGNLDRERGLMSIFGLDRNDLERHISDLQAMASLATTEPDKVLAIYDSLPESLQRQKVFLGWRIVAASCGDDDDTYLDALQSYQRWIPDSDPSREMLLLDAYLMRGKYDDAVDAMARLRERVGSEGWLPALQCGAMLEKGDYARARAYGEQAVANEPTLVDAHEYRVLAALTEGVPEHILSALTDYDVEFHPDQEWLAELEGYAEFLETPEGEEWRRIVDR